MLLTLSSKLFSAILLFSSITQLFKYCLFLSQVDQTNRNTLLLFVQATSEHVDYYKTLGVEKDATDREIQKAFRKLAKKYHPDKNKDKDAQDEFIKIFKAYETLSDAKKRKEYDEKSKSPFSGSYTSNFNAADFDMNDFFRQYEDHFSRHFHSSDNHDRDDEHYHQHRHNHQHHHQKFVFQGVNLENLFHNADEHEFPQFEHMFDTLSEGHQERFSQYHDHDMDHGFFGDGDSFFGSHFAHNSMHSRQQGSYSSCQTITRNINGVLMTQTSCS